MMISTGNPGERKYTILVIEDDHALRNLLYQFLTQEGFEVLTATNGHEALKHIIQPGGSPGLILTDVSLPGLDGFNLLEKVREKNPSVPVIFMTGLGLDTLERTGNLQPDAVLKKPVKLADIMAAIDKFV